VTEPTISSSEQSLGFERLVFFSDAVFAIVITLLVLPLTAEIELPKDGRSLVQHVLDQGLRVVSFVVSFLVIGQFWIAHHVMFRHVQRFDHGLLWFNLVTLLTVSFMPFPTAVLGARPDNAQHFPVIFYAASLTISSLTLTAMWLYARQRGLVDSSMPAEEQRRFSMRAAVTSGIFVLSIGGAFFGLWTAMLCWLLLLPAARILVSVMANQRTET
jgi:uncharacterized membrane protein